MRYATCEDLNKGVLSFFAPEISSVYVFPAFQCRSRFRESASVGLYYPCISLDCQKYENYAEHCNQKQNGDDSTRGP